MNGRTDLANDNDLIRAFEQFGTDQMDIETVARIVTLADLGIATKLGGKFERVDFYRLAKAFNCEIEEVHNAVGMTGYLYRQRATPDPVVMPEGKKLSAGQQFKLQLAGVTPEDYESVRKILDEGE